MTITMVTGIWSLLEVLELLSDPGCQGDLVSHHYQDCLELPVDQALPVCTKSFIVVTTQNRQLPPNLAYQVHHPFLFDQHHPENTQNHVIQRLNSYRLARSTRVSITTISTRLALQTTTVTKATIYWHH